MNMNKNISLFKLALERLEPSDWALFEQLCSAFLVTEFSNLRTMAHPSGDGGRDSELFTPEGKPIIAVQYSVTDEWKSKIRKTVKRLVSTFPDVRILVYMSNQQIGAQADELKRELLDQGISLDSRDRNWFTERASTNANRENAACELIDRIARPYLETENIIKKQTSPLTSGEARAALVYLGLQLQDDITDKGLTKLSFDALVRAALRHTHSGKRITRSEIHNLICSAISSADQSILIQHVDAALARLTKRYIRHWKKEDEFCLTYDEYQRILTRLADMNNQEVEFYKNVSNQCNECLCEINEVVQSDLEDLKIRVPRIIEKLLLRGGEVFVTDVLSNKLSRFGFTDLKDIILKDLEDPPKLSKILHHYPGIIDTVVHTLLIKPDKSTQHYLYRLSNSYTLFSFLNQTPDVQAATKKLFSHGTVWLDTSVILPLIAEQLDDPQHRQLSRILEACRDAGTELRVTTGIIEEINAHMNRALTYSQNPSTWKGRIPFLYYKYIQTGRSKSEFRKWLYLFRGEERPDDDLIQYLGGDNFNIKREDLKEAANQIDKELRWAVDRLWSDAHMNRRRNSQYIDDSSTQMLIQHDIETYLGVIALRQKENLSELGYRNWLLTLDRIAWEIRDRLKIEFQGKTPISPLLSLSFLFNSMTFGPSRCFFRNKAEFTLPLILDQELNEPIANDFLELANQIRLDNDELPESIIRRKVRDEFDKARRRKGCLVYNTIIESGEKIE